jgi:hypothetical protein
MGLRLRWHLPSTRTCVCLWQDSPKKVGAWWQGRCADRKFCAAAIFDFQRIYSLRASYMECDIRFKPV